MFSSYFKNFHPKEFSEKFFTLLSTLIPDPEVDIDTQLLSTIYNKISTNINFDANILVKFWIMKGYSPSNLLSLLDQKLLTLNTWEWICYDAKLRGDIILEKEAEKYLSNNTAELSNQGLFFNIEHWLFLFDPRTSYTSSIRSEAKKSLESLFKENDYPYHSVFSWMLVIEREWENLHEPEDIQELAKLLSSNDWDYLGSYWELTVLNDLVRLQLDFSDITNATITLSQLKNILEDSPLFLGIVLRHEGKFNFMENHEEEGDALLISSIYYFTQSNNYKQILFTQFLQVKLWSVKSKKRTSELLNTISLDIINKVNDPWIFGNYHLMLANIAVAKSQYTQASNHYVIGIENIRNSYDKITYWHALIDYGF